jgi:DNA-binding transcriptional MerR regulator
MPHTVGDVARIARVSVRTLHHYDAIGLLVPSMRSDAGYRLYGEADLERLQQILFYRELGFPLDDVARLLADTKLDRREALLAQRALLLEKRERADAMIRLVDRTLASIEKGAPMSHDQMFEGFDPKDYEDEAKERWGKTPEYAESKRRTSRYGAAEWAALRAEAQEIGEAYARVMDAGGSPRDPAAMDVAERARLHIDRWFYPCPKSMHAALGRMYADDPRFAANYDRIRPGLAQFVSEACIANAAR